jgi:hypothetical protein
MYCGVTANNSRFSFSRAAKGIFRPQTHHTLAKEGDIHSDKAFYRRLRLIGINGF